MGKNNLVLTNVPLNDEDNLKGPHDWISAKGTNATYCDKCGLVWLKNRISQVCIKAGCAHYKHPEYLAWRKNGYKF